MFDRVLNPTINKALVLIMDNWNRRWFHRDATNVDAAQMILVRTKRNETLSRKDVWRGRSRPRGQSLHIAMLDEDSYIHIGEEVEER